MLGADAILRVRNLIQTPSTTRLLIINYGAFILSFVMIYAIYSNLRKRSVKNDAALFARTHYEEMERLNQRRLFGDADS